MKTYNVELPSKGLVYEKTNPLSSGVVEILYPTAKHQDILLSESLIKNGTVLDRFLQELIVDKKIKYNDILSGDKNKILFAARMLAYGSQYIFDYTCQACGHRHDKYIIDISTLNDINIEEIENYDTIFVNKNEFVVELEGYEVKFKLPDGHSANEVKKLYDSQKNIRMVTKIDNKVSLYIKSLILAVNGESKKEDINSFVDNLPIMELEKLKAYISKITPNLDTNITLTCDKCSNMEETALPLRGSFFYPNTK